jgi:anti-sigma regulatory factor (Ser/Thr protein kinase)
MPSVELRTALRNDPNEVCRARNLVGSSIERWGVPDDGGVALLLVSELVTNALRYGVQPMRLVARGDAHGLRIEVHDGRVDERPKLREPITRGDLSGRGMVLVDTLATRWGCSEFGGSKQVWFETGPKTAAV